MIKYTWIKRTLAKATPLQREIATRHFNQLWEKYYRETEYHRLAYQARQIPLTTFRQFTRENFKHFRQELQGVLKVVVSK